jgi:molybdopterin-containing oxidoreductase family iron-sulfur binding subunit
MEKKYWQSIEEYKKFKREQAGNEEPVPEFSIEGLDESEVKGKSSRRDFLKMLGFSVSAAALVSSCQMPVRKAIPMLTQPEELVPGVANYYASTFYDGNDYVSVLVKTREGRPIKIEGNDLSPVSRQGTNARAQASVLNLYDDARLKKPMKGGKESTWKVIDKEVKEKLERLATSGKKVVLLTSTIISPSTKKLIEEFKNKYPNAEHVVYDPVSFRGMRDANEMNFGKPAIPSYYFDKAKVIVGFNADYLGNWLMPVTFSKQFAVNRRLHSGKKEMSRLYQFESDYSLTGSNADYRYPIRPSEESAVLLNLYNEIAKATGAKTYHAPKVKTDVKKAAHDLLKNKGRSLVVSGTNDLNIQLIVNAINQLLGNYGKTIDLDKPVCLYKTDEKAFADFIKEMGAGKIGGVLMYNVNPAYDYAKSSDFINGLKKVSLKVSFADTMDETAKLCEYVCPDNNYLESWNDAQPVMGSYSFTQPTINPIFDTRQFQESLMKWTDISGTFEEFMATVWEYDFFPKQTKYSSFTDFWNTCKHDGVIELPFECKKPTEDYKEQALKAAKPKDGVEVILYQKMSLGTGKYANNPWLLEMPDPLTTATWDNYVGVSVDFAEKHGLEHEDVVKVDDKIELPVLIRPGLPENTVAIAVGFGRTSAGKAGDGVGKNVYPLMNLSNGYFNYGGTSVRVEKVAGKKYELALTQMHHTMEGRPIVRETTLKDYIKNPASGNEKHKLDDANNVTLYQHLEFDGIQWGMSIDLNVCTGCSNCVISCQAENNVAVVGKDQVRRRRIMHWMRIDRYYSEDFENPEVFHMPVMCQHCDNAPCENVCPVAATNHSSEGLNQMAYNRCIGTRYCINNCPYKVRRFNWYEYVNNNSFDYNMNSELGKLVLNPDVTVRQRGVVEKCSLCVQRIQEKKLQAKIENRDLVDGEIQVACQQSCPTDAIQFGNLLDEKSKVAQLVKEQRMYHLLEELHTLPSASYLTKVKNKDESTHKEGHHA